MYHHQPTRLFVLALAAFAGHAQTAFLGLTPGESTRADVVKLLGQPVRKLGATRFEYAPPAGIAKVEVEYQASGEIVREGEVHFLRPVTRKALVDRLSLTQQATTRKNGSGQLVEFFADPALVSLTYATGEVASGVSQVGYHSREAASSAPATTAPRPDAAFGPMEEGVVLNGTNLTYYQRPAVEQCRADCLREGRCKGFTWIKAGTYNPSDAAMCYLVSEVGQRTRAAGHISAVKTGR